MSITVMWYQEDDLGNEIEYEVECVVERGHKGSMYEPPDPGEVDVVAVYRNGKELDRNDWPHGVEDDEWLAEKAREEAREEYEDQRSRRGRDDD